MKDTLISFVLGGIIGGVAALAQGQENVLVHLLTIIVCCVVAAIIYVRQIKEE